MRPDLLARLAARQQAQAEAGLLRRLRTVEDADSPWLVIDGRRLLGFAGNDYLGLAAHPALREALLDAARRWGVGATAAHLLGGHRAPHAELEAALADWTGREAALLFATGYMANIGVLDALLSRGDICVQDRLNHASLLDGARLCGAVLRRYPHADADAAARRLTLRPGTAALLASDGVFSMDGDVAPLRALAAQARAAQATLLIDDAHGLGVSGPRGAGSVAAAGLDAGDVPVLIGTLGKALGTQGAFVAGPRALIEALAQFARAHVYSTAPPPAVAAATLAALHLARQGEDLRARLAARIAQLRAGAAALGLRLLPSQTPIQPLLLGAARTALAWSHALEQAGLYVPAIRPPTVPVGQARLRIVLSAAHGAEHVARLLDALAALRARADAAADPAIATP
ncbi:8-amino-7-oxononanoate synthase [Metallibacterium scheffleri]|jgi:8-amino-7-oxononanoate synthase|uniref:8-amino-7-oxononanoate synthase n=2 Tax=Metallibacterium TaxID=1218803 RepID=UPI0026EEA553|nr:8-amino-7-oxononanoate synthase [Metallibacterium scheffleri]MBW8073899.1 8-amino-7-oxononanoate synthase [Metallibacterium scheffleri]